MTAKKESVKVYVVKFVPDLIRCEPRNMGVIVWLNGQVKASFRDARALPKTNRNAYQQWVDYWQYSIGCESLVRSDTGDVVFKSSPDYMVALRSHSKPGCMLCVAAEIDPVHVDDLAALVNEMYAVLVVEDVG